MARKHIEKDMKRDMKRVDPYAVAAVSPSYMRFIEAYGICGEDYVRPLNLTKYPFKMPIGWANGFISNPRLRSPVTIVLDPITGEALNTQINRTVNMADPQVGDGMLTFTERSAKQFQAENAAQINQMLMNENAKLFNATVYVVLRADSADDIKPRKEYLDDVVFKANRARVEKQLSNTQSAFFAASPCLTEDVPGTNAYGVPMPAETVAMGEFTQVYGFDDGAGIMLGTDNNGGAVRLDFHKHTVLRPNGNIILVCEAGNGKSTLMKHILLNENMLHSTRVIVAADPDSEYAHMCQALGGEVTDPVGKLSPFEPRNIASSDSIEDETEETSEYYGRALQERVLSNHIPFLKTFLQMAFPLIDDETAGVLGTPVTRIYGKYGIMPETTFAQYYAGAQEFPVLEDLYHELMREADEERSRDAERAASLRRAAVAIEDASIGYDREAWNVRGRFNPTSKFIVIDTSNLSADKNVKSAQLYNILMWVWSQVRSHRFDGESYTRIVMDELNSIVNKENKMATAQIADMVRRVRKYNAGVMFAFQVVNSLLDDEIRTEGQIILDNCVYKFFGSQSGKQAGGNLWSAQQYLALTDKVRDDLGKATRGHFILSIGKKDKTWVHVDAIQPWEFELFGQGGGK